MRSKKIIKAIKIVSILLLASGLIIVGCVLRMQYVFLDHKIYKNDIKKLHGVYLDSKNVKISELNRCSELEYLSVWGADDVSLTEMRNFNNLHILDISCSDISDVGIAKINILQNLNEILFMKSNIDFSNIRNDSIKKISVILCDMTDIKKLADCSSLTELCLIETTMDDKIIKTDGANILDRKYYLKDSSDFAYLNNIETLSIYNIKIEDVSGFTEMDKLKTFKADEGSISEEDIKILEDKGITVVEKTDDN